jgi:hypothetical protein
LNGSTSGYTELDAPAVAGNNTLVLPTGNGSDGNILGTDGAGNLSWVGGRMVLETAKASTSGTSVDFTGIPSWVKRVTVMFGAVSTNGSSIILLQLGSGSVQTTGYSGTIWTDASSGQFTTGFPVFSPVGAANNAAGIVQLISMGSNVWAQSGILAFGNVQSTGWSSAGFTQSSLSGALDRIRITTVNGTDTFDGGSLNLLLEG